MECLKVARDKRHLEQLYGQIKQAEKQLEMEQSRLETEQAEFAKKRVLTSISNMWMTAGKRMNWRRG